MKNKWLLSATFVLCIMVLALFPVEGAADTMLDVPEIAQQHDQWCWAGASRATLDYYEKSVSQCEIANFAWGRTDCCASSYFYWSHTCNRPNAMYNASGSVQAILAHWGVNSTGRASYLSERPASLRLTQAGLLGFDSAGRTATDN